MGQTRVSNRLPKAMLEPFPDGGYIPDFESMLLAYYEAPGWDSDTGKPSRKKLVLSGLEDIANDLWREAD